MSDVGWHFMCQLIHFRALGKNYIRLSFIRGRGGEFLKEETTEEAKRQKRLEGLYFISEMSLLLK